MSVAIARVLRGGENLLVITQQNLLELYDIKSSIFAHNTLVFLTLGSADGNYRLETSF